MRQILVAAMLAGISSTALSCGGPTKRVTGQNELFEILPSGEIRRTLPSYHAESRRTALGTRTGIDGTWGDIIQFNDDVVTLQVVSMYLDHVPTTLTGSRDVIVFAEVWESGEGGYDGPRLNSIVHIARNQMIPGRLSFEANVGYGPTTFKGHPLKVRFTAMILQKQEGQRLGSAADVIGNFSAAATIGTPYGAIASTLIGLVREILRSQPDVIAMDFEFTGLSPSPEGLMPTALGPSGGSATAIAPQSVNSVFQTGQMLLGTGLPKAKSEELQSALAKARVDKSDLDSAWQAVLGPLSQRDLDNLAAVEPQISSITKADPKDGLTWEDRGDSIVLCINAVCIRLDKVADKERLEALRSALSRFTMSYREVERKLEAASPSAGDSLYRDWPWLRYGMYAVVETAERSRYGSSGQRSGFRLGFDRSVAFDQGWLRWLNDGKLGNAIDTNYIVFSLTPGQIAEADHALLAASNADAQIMTRLRQSDNDLKASSAKMLELAHSVNRRVAEARAEQIARRVAKSVEKQKNADQFDGQFDTKFDEAFRSLGDGELGAGATEWKNGIKASLKERWNGRFEALGGAQDNNDVGKAK